MIVSLCPADYSSIPLTKARRQTSKFVVRFSCGRERSFSFGPQISVKLQITRNKNYSGKRFILCLQTKRATHLFCCPIVVVNAPSFQNTCLRPHDRFFGRVFAAPAHVYGKKMCATQKVQSFSTQPWKYFRLSGLTTIYSMNFHINLPPLYSPNE